MEIYDPDKDKKVHPGESLDDDDNESDGTGSSQSPGPAETMTSQQYLWKFIHLYSETNRKYRQKTPFLILTSTTDSQKFLTDKLGGGSIACTDHRIDEIHNNHATGRGNIFYQNSIISRGLDIPFYHSTFVYACNFATPYWTAMRDHYQDLLLTPAEDGADQDTEEKKYELILTKIQELNNIIRHIQMDETTNGILRTAPIIGKYEDHIKLVVYSERHKALVSGAQYNGTTIIPVPTTAPIEPLIAVMRRLVDPVVAKVADEQMEHLSIRPFHSSTVDQAKALINQHMNNYEEALEAYNLPIDRVGYDLLTQPYLLDGKRLAEDVIVTHCFTRVKGRISKKTIRQVIIRLTEGNILKSMMSTGTGPLHRMYFINEIALARLQDTESRKDLILSLLSSL